MSAFTTAKTKDDPGSTGNRLAVPTGGGSSGGPATAPSSASRHAPATSLTSMPSAWLRELVLHPELSSQDIVRLFRSCKVMRDLVLDSRNTLVDIYLLGQADAAAMATAKLVLACKLSSKVKLTLNRCAPESAEIAGHMMSTAMEVTGHGLEGIISCSLQGLELDALVPSWLTTTCPKMTSLQLEFCRFNSLPAPDTPFPEFSQLQQLDLVNCWSPVRPLLVHWQHQLRALTGLTMYGVSHSNPELFLWRSLDVLSAQLTHLSLPRYTVDDQGMEVLLNTMPRLKHLSCQGFQLQQSYNQRPCTWTHLQVADMDIASLERLPLAGIQSVSGSAIAPSTDLAFTNRVVAKLISSGVQWVVPSVRVDNLGVDADNVCLAALMPLLASCDELFLAHVTPVTAELLAAIGQHLGRCHTIKFFGCSWAPEALLPILPASICSVVISFFCGVSGTEAGLTRMCVHACRPIRLAVMSSVQGMWQQGWQGRVQAAMAAAGHQHVKLVVGE